MQAFRGDPLYQVLVAPHLGKSSASHDKNSGILVEKLKRKIWQIHGISKLLEFIESDHFESILPELSTYFQYTDGALLIYPRLTILLVLADKLNIQ